MNIIAEHVTNRPLVIDKKMFIQLKPNFYLSNFLL